MERELIYCAIEGANPEAAINSHPDLAFGEWEGSPEDGVALVEMGGDLLVEFEEEGFVQVVIGDVILMAEMP